MSLLAYPEPIVSERAEALRTEVRAFLKEQLREVGPRQRIESWNRVDPAFSRALGKRGWLGLTWPKKYGGHERTALERYVVVEETLAAGAPLSAHMIAERQSGPTLLRYGTEEQKMKVLPRIAAGDCIVCIGMSEPDSGSDLAAVRTRATQQADGTWRVNGTKVWTTNAHVADYMILFCRTSGDAKNRHVGTSQLLVDLKNTPGLSIRPIIDLGGRHHFNEVHFDDAVLPAGALIGREGCGWEQVMSELAFERSGPERFLSSLQVLIELIRALKGAPGEAAILAVGRMTAHLVVLRRMSRGVAVLLEQGADPNTHAAIIKDLGITFEQEIPEIARLLIDGEADLGAKQDFFAVLAYAVLNTPSFSLRGGTREILRGIVARGLGLR